MATELLVRAVDGARVCFLTEKSEVKVGRYVGRNKRHEALPGGERVLDHHHYRRAINRGELELLEEAEV